MIVGARLIIYLHTLQRNEITSPQGNAARQRITIVIRGMTYSPFSSSLLRRHFNVLVEHIPMDVVI
jgi:Mg/Co/Ni transporter MgtE